MLMYPWGEDSSYHIQTNVSVERGVFGGITIHKGEVLFLSIVCIEKA